MEVGSLRRSRRGKETKEPYFGIYHHSTSTASKKIRLVVRTMFVDAFASLPFERYDELTILDVGCGLGFLSCVSAEFYKNARITGIDTFKHTSLKRSSLERAKENARILGFQDRIDFKKGDVFGFTPAEKFDMIVSNLVLHNLGKKRFEAYSRISSWAKAGSFFVMGDLLFSSKTDIDQLTKAFKMWRQIKPKSAFGQYTLLVMSKVNPAKKKYTRNAEKVGKSRKIEHGT
jgi:cyclopropane fatty-acyl-phospholipid synthase-like methyltransferase